MISFGRNQPVPFFSFRAQTNCDVFVLTKKDLDEVLTHYPQIRKKILETAEERQRMVAERAKAFAKKKEEDKKREEENKLKVFDYYFYFCLTYRWINRN